MAKKKASQLEGVILLDIQNEVIRRMGIAGDPLERDAISEVATKLIEEERRALKELIAKQKLELEAVEGRRDELQDKVDEQAHSEDNPSAEEYEDLKTAYLTLARESLDFFRSIENPCTALQHLVHDVDLKVHELES